MSWEEARLLRRQVPFEAKALIAAAIDGGVVKMSAGSFKEAIDRVASSSVRRMDDI